METSKVRKFWTFNPFYPELSGMLITFILSFSLFWGDSNLDFFSLYIYLLWVVLFLLLFYPLVEIQKKKKLQKANLQEKYICIFNPLSFFPFAIFFFNLIVSGHFLKKNSYVLLEFLLLKHSLLGNPERDGG